MKRHYIHIGDLNNMRITSTCSAYGGKLQPININNTNKYENENLFKNAADSLCYHIGADSLHE